MKKHIETKKEKKKQNERKQSTIQMQIKQYFKIIIELDLVV